MWSEESGSRRQWKKISSRAEQRVVSALLSEKRPRGALDENDNREAEDGSRTQGGKHSRQDRRRGGEGHARGAARRPRSSRSAGDEGRLQLRLDRIRPHLPARGSCAE